MSFDDELAARIDEEIERLKEIMVAGNMDIRMYDRYIGGIHALRQITEIFIPETRKKLNER